MNISLLPVERPNNKSKQFKNISVFLFHISSESYWKPSPHVKKISLYVHLPIFYLSWCLTGGHTSSINKLVTRNTHLLNSDINPKFINFLKKLYVQIHEKNKYLIIFNRVIHIFIQIAKLNWQHFLKKITVKYSLLVQFI